MYFLSAGLVHILKLTVNEPLKLLVHDYIHHEHLCWHISLLELRSVDGIQMFLNTYEMNSLQKVSHGPRFSAGATADMSHARGCLKLLPSSVFVE